jgi:recombination associated protein RdgC
MKPLELMEQGRFLGEEFLLWLWMRSMTEGGASGEDGDGSGCFVDDAIQLVSERGEVKEISLRKGNPSESREAFEALSRGMRPSKVKLRILSGDLEWVFTLNAATLDMGTLKLPPSTGKAPHERLHDRIFLLEEGAGHLERRLKRFLRARNGDSEGLQEALRAWVRAGRSGEALVTGEAPWEA